MRRLWLLHAYPWQRGQIVTFAVTDLLALISSPDNVGDNWRIIRPFTRLRQAGIDARWYWGAEDQIIGTDPERTVLVVRLMTGTDACTIDRWLAERRPAVRAIVYELDDISWGDAMVTHLRDADFLQGKTEAELLRQGEIARYLASKCDGIITSSEPLSEIVRRDIPGAHVVTVANAIDTRWFRAQMAHRAPWADHLTIGWCGGRRPEADVIPMAEAWGRIAKRYPAVRFVLAAPLIPDAFYRCLDDIDQVIRFPWVSWPDSPVLYQTTIGCAAVSESPFSRCKTPIKALEYGTTGAAVVATPALYGEVIEHERNGLLATTADEWEHALSRLIEDEELRLSINRELQGKIEREYSLDVNLHRWPVAMQAIVGAKALVGV